MKMQMIAQMDLMMMETDGPMVMMLTAILWFRRRNTTFGCNDAYDNDFDGLIDADDPECIISWDDTEDGAPPSCEDGADDDGDGWTDDGDPDCALMVWNSAMDILRVTMVIDNDPMEI